MNIFVANLPYQVNEDKLLELFEKYGEVSSVKIIIDKLKFILIATEFVYPILNKGNIKMLATRPVNILPINLPYPNPMPPKA